MSLRLLSCTVFAALALVACAPEIGDACENALDCSSQGSRLCDRTQPNGYCTIRGCEPGTCPGESVCVKFRPQEERLSFTYCMFECGDDSDCRNDEGYVCTSAEEFGESGAMDAVILGREDQKFCSIPALPPSEEGPPPGEPGDASAAGDASAIDDAATDGATGE